MDNQADLQQIFTKVTSFSDTHQSELIEQQEKLGNMLNTIQEEMQQLINSAHFEKDKHYYQQFDRINTYKKRLELITQKMGKVQGRVDILEKRFTKIHKENQLHIAQNQTQQQQ